jgi:hypothetical protein
MNNGEVYTYHNVLLGEDNGLNILVYDRNSSSGLSVLNLDEVKATLTEYSENYNILLKEFLKFLSKDLRNEPLLQKYIAGIWNDDLDVVDDAYDEDYSLPERFIAYMDELIERSVFDEVAVRYFNAVYCEQEITYPKYNKNWLVTR